MKLLDFLNEHYENWEALLSAPPYCLNIQKDNDYVLFKYDMLKSSMKEPVCREARGCIFYDCGDRFKLVCYPFDKFFNYEEPSNDIEPDWSTAKVQEKIDGSLIKLWFHKGWHISTNGCIDAYKAFMPSGLSFGDAVKTLIPKEQLLSIDYTYMFEFVSPYNQVVVFYEQPCLYYLGKRNIITLEEDSDIPYAVLEAKNIKLPESYPLSTIEECKDAANALGEDKEGFVVVDAAFNRVKIKSPKYVMLHHSISNVAVTYKLLLDLLDTSSLDDFLSLKKSYKVMVDDMLAVLSKVEKTMDAEFNKYCFYDNPKDLALAIKDNPYKAYIFKKYYDSSMNPIKYLLKLPRKNAVSILKDHE